MDLVLHAGLPKTATTTIQNHLLSGVPGYLGKDAVGSGFSAGGRLVDELCELATMHKWLGRREVERRTREWVGRVASLGQNSGSVGNTISVSHEGLVFWPVDGMKRWQRAFREAPIQLDDSRRRTGAIPVAEYLAEYLIPAWKENGRVRVCITLRNQPEWLASRYAQRATSIWSASQRDFEAQIAKLVETNDPGIDWYGITRAIADAVDEENLRVLLFEDIGGPDFWRGMLRFMGHDESLIERVYSESSTRENVRRSTEPGVWTIRSRSKRRLLYSHLSEQWSMSETVFSRRFVLPVLRVCEPVIVRPVLDCRRDRTIRLTPSIIETVRSHFFESNRNLGRWLDRDLQLLGY